MSFRHITLFSEEVGLDLLTVISVTLNHVCSLLLHGTRNHEFCVLLKIPDLLMHYNSAQGKVKLPWNYFIFVSTGGNGTAEILAKDSQSKRSHVFKWTRRNFRCYWTIWICKSYGASLQTASQMCVQSTLSGLYLLHVQ